MAGIGPQLPPHLRSSSTSKEDENKDSCKVDNSNTVKTFGPVLPPGFSDNVNKGTFGPVLPSRYSDSDNVNKGTFSKHMISDIIGPSLPKDYSKRDDSNDSDESDNDVIGPSLPSHNTDQPGNSNQNIKEQFEERARAMKNKLTGNNVENTTMQRESWMLELPPEVGKNFGLGPRTFRANAVDLGDRSVWTDTPSDRERKRKQIPEEEPAKKKQVPTEKELASRASVDEYNERNRPQSLLDMHREKHKTNDTCVRRPFDRDKDLALHRKDPKAKEEFIKAAKQMNNKFSSGNYEDKFI